jgi:hypothetical protein
MVVVSKSKTKLMIPVTQTKVCVKNSKGKYVVRGNCFQACIASIMELPISEVPDFSLFFEILDKNEEKNEWVNIAQKWFGSKGWDWMSGDDFKQAHESNVFSKDTEGVPYLVVGKSPRGINHCCI